MLFLIDFVLTFAVFLAGVWIGGEQVMGRLYQRGYLTREDIEALSKGEDKLCG
jgi:hypothetical protein